MYEIDEKGMAWNELNQKAVDAGYSSLRSLLGGSSMWSDEVEESVQNSILDIINNIDRQEV